MPLGFPPSSVLVLAGNSLHSIFSAGLVSQVESLLSSHRLEDVVNLVQQERKKLQSNITVDSDQTDQLRYVYQRLGFQCFTETLFEDAGGHFFDGELDPRLLVSYYPELRGSMLSAEDVTNVFSGVAEHMPKEDSVDDIIRNYSPHLSPNTRSAPPTAELRKILGMAAEDMLESFLRKCRNRRRVDNIREAAVDSIIDTVLVKLFAQFEKTSELYGLTQLPNDVILSEVEPVLQRFGQYNALCLLYRQGGLDEKLLDAWSKVVDKTWLDEDIKDPISNMVNLLKEKADRSLSQRWGIWLSKRDPTRGLDLLMNAPMPKRKDKCDNDETLLQQLQEESPLVAEKFLEHLVLQKRSSSKSLHTQYACMCVRQLVEFLHQDSVARLWRAKSASYSSSSTSFLSYFASTTPESDHKCVRIKANLFLQASSLYDLDSVRTLISPHEKALQQEMAIIYGKSENHRAALHLLVHALHDSVSAEAYCLSGDVVSTKVALSIIQSMPSLQPFEQLWANGGNPTLDTAITKQLLRTLLEVYMLDRNASAGRAAHLLDSQAVNLDAIDVIPLVPLDWPLTRLSSFLTRSFRRTLHQRREGQITRTLSLGQNLAVKEKAWLVLRDADAVLEEVEDEEVLEEVKGINEKGVSMDPEVEPEVVEVLPDSKESSQLEEDNIIR